MSFLWLFIVNPISSPEPGCPQLIGKDKLVPDCIAFSIENNLNRYTATYLINYIFFLYREKQKFGSFIVQEMILKTSWTFSIVSRLFDNSHLNRGRFIFQQNIWSSSHRTLSLLKVLIYCQKREGFCLFFHLWDKHQKEKPNALKLSLSSSGPILNSKL